MIHTNRRTQIVNILINIVNKASTTNIINMTDEIVISMAKHHRALYDKENVNYNDRAGVVMNIWRRI